MSRSGNDSDRGPDVIPDDVTAGEDENGRTRADTGTKGRAGRQSTGIEPLGDAESEPDFAGEHDQTAVGEDATEDGETESPQGHSGLESTPRPN